MQGHEIDAVAGLRVGAESPPRYFERAPLTESLLMEVTPTRSLWTPDMSMGRPQHLEPNPAAIQNAGPDPTYVFDTESPMTLAEFVQQKFIPEYVQTRTPGGQAHFRAILKHILPLEQVARGFTSGEEAASVKRHSIQGWPYLDSLELGDVTGARIQHLLAIALECGYSTQTATHIRNVIRAIFSHAISSGCYSGTNPAVPVILPAMTRKEAPSLSLMQLQQIIPVMRYPEKLIALFVLLTEMNVAEICGLQWKNVNLLNSGQSIDGDWLPPKTIAIRHQTYRGEFGLVPQGRRRIVPVPALLYPILLDMKSRVTFTRPQDFVLASRNGTPVHPENIAARRLKAIGRARQVPWLCWSVFQRTHMRLRTELGRNLHKEYERVLALKNR